jgi:hypothetical protein
MKRVIALLALVLHSLVWGQPTEFKGNVWVRKSLTVDSTPAAALPRSLIVKDSATSHKFKEWDLDTFLVWLNAHGSGSSPHGIDSTYIAYSTGGSTWGQLPLNFYANSTYSKWLRFVNYPFESSGEKSFAVDAPDTTRLLFRAGTCALTLCSRNSAYTGTFALQAAPGIVGTSDISAYRLRLTVDSLLTIRGKNIVIRDNAGTFMSFDGLVANGAVNVSRKLRFSSLPTITSTVSVYAPSSDTIALIRADSLTVKRAASAALSDSTGKNAPHNVTTGRHAVSSGTNTWSTSTIREADSCVGIGIASSTDRRLALSFAPLNAAGGYGLHCAYSPQVTADGYHGGSALRFLMLTNIAAGVTDLSLTGAMDGFAFHNSQGRCYGGVFGLQFGYGTLGATTGRCDRAYGIITDPTSEGNGPIPLMIGWYNGPRHGAVTPTEEWFINSDQNAPSRFEGGLQLDNDVNRVYLGESQQASIFHDGTDMIFNTTAGLFWFTGASARYGSSANNTKIDSTGITSKKWKDTPEGGRAIKIVNRTGAASVKGYMVHPSPSYDTSCTLSIVDVPDPIGVVYDSGVANGSEMWVVTNGIADVYFIGSATRGHIARGFVTGDAGYVAGQALSEAVPSPPFATDKHFYEIGHVIQSRTGAGLARCVLHQN